MAGLILPHDHFGSHLDQQGRTTDRDLEKKNFEHAGKVLAEVWGQLVIDGHKVVSEYVNPDEHIPLWNEEVNLDAAWFTRHVRELQYFLQISKCLDEDCCSKPRSKLRSILPDGFLPPPLRLTDSLEAASPASTEGAFIPLFVQLAMKIDFPTERLTSVPYDFYCPSIQDQLLKRICKKCGHYFGSQQRMKDQYSNLHLHADRIKEETEPTPPLRRSARILKRREGELLVEVRDQETGEAIEVEWMQDEEAPGDSGEENEELPSIESLSEWLSSPWTEENDVD